MNRLVLLVAVLAVAGCGGSSNAQPKGDPGAFAVKVVGQIVHNQYATVWSDLHPTDQKVAPSSEYVQCEARSPVIAQPRTMKVLSVGNESVGLGDGSFVESKAVHVVAAHGKWTWILPAWRFRDYKADKCPVDAGSPPPAPTA